MTDEDDYFERLIPLSAKIKHIFSLIEDEDWDGKFLITSVLYHQACRSIGLSADGMCDMIRKIDERENRQKENKRTVQ